MLELSSPKLEVKLGEKVYELRRCSAVEAKKLFKKMKEVDQEKDPDQLMDIQEDLLRDCGASDDLLSALDFDGFNQLAQYVMGEKKS